MPMFTVANHPHFFSYFFDKEKVPLGKLFSLVLLLFGTDSGEDASKTAIILVSLCPGSADIYLTRLHNMHFFLPPSHPLTIISLKTLYLEWNLGFVLGEITIKIKTGSTDIYLKCLHNMDLFLCSYVCFIFFLKFLQVSPLYYRGWKWRRFICACFRIVIVMDTLGFDQNHIFGCDGNYY